MDIFVIRIVDADEVHKELLKEFQKREITNPEALNRHCFSYLMTDRILREFYKIEDREIVFGGKDGKKPLLKSGEKHFSISHSKDFAAIAFSDSNCGIDIEKIQPRDYKKVAKKMGFNSETEEDFYNDWTKYEAEYKLDDKTGSAKSYKLDNYSLTAVSVNPEEEYNLYYDCG